MKNRLVADIRIVTVTLEIRDTKALFVLLANDGTVNRMGSGSPATADGAMFIGMTRPPLIDEALKGFPDGMLALKGSYDAIEKQGVTCRLSIALGFSDGSENGFAYMYGNDSQGPPDEVTLFVRRVVAATQPWYLEQRRLAAKHPAPTMPPPKAHPWWRFW